MVRPTFLMAEPVPGEGISSRKLVLETAYFNVLTAYSTPELMDSLKKFPVDAVIVHTGLERLDMTKVSEALREHSPSALLIALSHTNTYIAPDADEVISSHDPQALLGYVQEKFGRLKQVP